MLPYFMCLLFSSGSWHNGIASASGEVYSITRKCYVCYWIRIQNDHNSSFSSFSNDSNSTLLFAMLFSCRNAVCSYNVTIFAAFSWLVQCSLFCLVDINIGWLCYQAQCYRHRRFHACPQKHFTGNVLAVKASSISVIIWQSRLA